MDHLSMKFSNGLSGVLVRIHLHECDAAISLHVYLRKVSDRSEERDQVRLGAIRDEISNVDGSVVRGRLPRNCVVRVGRSSCSVQPLLPPPTRDGPSMDYLSLELNNGHSGVPVRVHLHECKTAISLRLHAYLQNVSNRLEERDQIRLSTIRDEVANVDGSVVHGRLPHDCLVRGTTQEVHSGRSTGNSATTHWRARDT